jgi:hypothetical protein
MKDVVPFEDVVFRVMRRRVMRGHEVRRRSGLIGTRCRNARLTIANESVFARV